MKNIIAAMKLIMVVMKLIIAGMKIIIAVMKNNIAVMNFILPVMTLMIVTMSFTSAAEKLGIAMFQFPAVRCFFGHGSRNVKGRELCKLASA